MICFSRNDLEQIGKKSLWHTCVPVKFQRMTCTKLTQSKWRKTCFTFPLRTSTSLPTGLSWE